MGALWHAPSIRSTLGDLAKSHNILNIKSFSPEQALAIRESETYTCTMKKRVVDIPAQDLDRLAGRAWQDAATRSLGRGVAVVGRQGEQLTKIFPDGRQETIRVRSEERRVGKEGKER